MRGSFLNCTAANMDYFNGTAALDYQWKPEDSQRVKDSPGEYRVIINEGGQDRYRLMLRRNDDAVLVRFDNENKGISIRHGVLGYVAVDLNQLFPFSLFRIRCL